MADLLKTVAAPFIAILALAPWALAVSLWAGDPIEAAVLAQSFVVALAAAAVYAAVGLVHSVLFDWIVQARSSRRDA